ncbi:MAG: NAD-binding protein, partial [Planctomycetes bacterium]|nr:NAD-binding protein [Planctomycetota bacterium]
TCRRKRPAAERAFLLGDAAGYVEPFTGEGLAWALAAGAAVAPIACRACRDWQPELAVQWSYRYRRLVARHQWVCRRVAGVLRRPALTRALVAVLARAPALASPLIRYLNLPDSASGGC